MKVSVGAMQHNATKCRQKHEAWDMLVAVDFRVDSRWNAVEEYVTQYAAARRIVHMPT